MQSKYVLGVSLVIALAAPVGAQPGYLGGEVKEADKATPLAAWTAAQQWQTSGTISTHGYNSAFGMLVLADELGDKLAETGRATLLAECFEYAEAKADAALRWAVCGPDAKALDLKKLDAQLAADKLNPDSRKRVVDAAKDIQDKVLKIGAAVEAAAKDDPGVAAVLKLADTAKGEWAAWLGKNQATFDRYLALKDAVRSNKSNHKNFAGCWEATQPAFAKLVKQTKYPWELSGDYLPGYLSYMLGTIDGYMTTATFSYCAYSIDASGEGLAAAVSNQSSGGVRVGWRTLALAKALDPNFKPKFADRSLNFDSMRRDWERDVVKLKSLNDVVPIMTPAQGVVASAKKDGDVVKLQFKGDKVDACLQWKETKKVAQITPNGSVSYEKVCVKRGKVDNQEHATEIHAKFAAGVAPGVNVLLVNKFPVVAWKGKKFVAVFGVPK